MYRRIIVLSAIIGIALVGLTGLGFRAIQIQAEGLENRRWGEFASVAEQIRLDVKRKLDAFIQLEQSRPYTDYQHYYVPENAALPQQAPLLRSPLADTLSHGFAYGYFQVEPDGTVLSPYRRGERPNQNAQGASDFEAYLQHIRRDVLSQLNGNRNGGVSGGLRISRNEDAPLPVAKREYERSPSASAKKSKDINLEQKSSFEFGDRRGQSLPIESLQKGREAQVMSQSRAVYESNVQSNRMVNADALPAEGGMAGGMAVATVPAPSAEPAFVPIPEQSVVPKQATRSNEVQVRLEPFVPIGIQTASADEHLFGKEFFLLRHVQIENRHLLQGFRLDDQKLLEEVRESAGRLMRDGMKFEISQAEIADAAYTAILDFGFGELVVSLQESRPGWIQAQIGTLRTWYFSIVGVVLAAVSLGLASLWKNAREQVRLAKKKDDFISAVSHELRTPLTSLRMYTEMLEKNWILSEDKRKEYYQTMRQENERLSRLIDNVLDFSRIQRGKKQYRLEAGDLNACVARAAEMMIPYAQQAGFVLEKEFSMLPAVAFDADAVMQIVINLIDNAIKYAKNSEEKKIILRTKREDPHVLIEVEDRGPGLPNRQRKKVFDEFYRCEDEARRETTGVGLGLALVKQYALAHDGFVDIASAKPQGAIFRVGLTAIR